jgi:predicted nucleic acid-binding protein
MKYLLDTNIISEVMKKASDPRVVHWFTTLDRIVLCAISLEVLFFGLRRRSLFQKEAWLRQMLADKGDILSVSDTSTMWSGERRAVFVP